MDELWAVRDGQVLTPQGWMPEQMVQWQREQVQRKQRTAMWVGVAGLFCVGLVLGPIAIVMGYLANEDANKWGVPTSANAYFVGGIALVGSMFVLAFALAASTP